MRLCSKSGMLHVEGPYSSNIWEEARYGATLDKLRWNVHVGQGRTKGQRSMPVLERCECKYEKICARSVDTTNAARQLCAARGAKTESKKCPSDCVGRVARRQSDFQEEIEQKEGKELQMEKGVHIRHGSPA